jgi:hypothetical protein
MLLVKTGSAVRFINVLDASITALPLTIRCRMPCNSFLIFRYRLLTR